MKTQVAKADVYTRVTDRIIASLESGVRPWMKPWTTPSDDRSSILPLRHTGEPYRGINVLLLWGDAMEKGFTRNVWMTFKQAEAYGAHVRKGEHGSLVVFADRATKTETNEKGEETEREFAFMKAYTVFNVEQIEGLGSRFAPAVAPEARPDLDLIAQAEAFFAGTAAVFRHGGHRAFYAPGPDVIQLPMPTDFRDAESYAATKAHELIHAKRREVRATGLAGFLGRITGVAALRRAIHRHQDNKLTEMQRKERAELTGQHEEARKVLRLRQSIQLQEIERKTSALTRLEAREIASLKRDLLREQRVKERGPDNTMSSVQEKRVAERPTAHIAASFSRAGRGTETPAPDVQAAFRAAAKDRDDDRSGEERGAERQPDRDEPQRGR